MSQKPTLLITLLLGFAIGPCRGETAPPPNVLIVMADDWGWPYAGKYGADWIRTPNFDRVADEGVLFRNAFANVPSCTPSRATVLTGRYHWRLGPGATMWGTFPSGLRTYTDVLEEHGYFIGSTNKGWGPGDERAGGSDQILAGKPYTVNFTASKSSRPPTITPDNVYAESFEKFLGARNSSDPAKPFCFWLGAKEPHRPYKASAGVETGINPDEVDVPAFLPDNDVVRKDLAAMAAEIEYLDGHLGQIMDHLEKTGELDRTIILVTGDHGIPFPRAKKTIYEYGIHVPLAVRWGNGIKVPHVIDDLVSFIDFAPTFLECAGIDPSPFAFDGRSFLDLLKTDRNGVAAPETRKYIAVGSDRHKLNADNVEISGLEGAGYPMRGIRSRGHLYIRNYEPTWFPDAADASPTDDQIRKNGGKEYPDPYALAYGTRPAEELYDIISDPDCVKNLAPDLVLEKTLVEHRQAMESILEKTCDPRHLGYGETFFGNRFYRKNGMGSRYKGWDSRVEKYLAEKGNSGLPRAVEAAIGVTGTELGDAIHKEDRNGSPVLDFRISDRMREFRTTVLRSSDTGTGWTPDGITTEPLAVRDPGYSWFRAVPNVLGASPVLLKLDTRFDPMWEFPEVDSSSAGLLAIYDFSEGKNDDLARTPGLVASAFTPHGEAAISASSGNAFLRSSFTRADEKAAFGSENYFTFKVASKAQAELLRLEELRFDFGATNSSGSAIRMALHIASDASPEVHSQVVTIPAESKSAKFESAAIDLTGPGFKGKSSVTFEFRFSDDLNEPKAIPRLDNIRLRGSIDRSE